MMAAKTYEYRAFLEELSLFFEQIDCEELWEYTKRMVHAHNENKTQAWREFDHTLTGEEISVPLQGLILNMISEMPEKHHIDFHRVLTIGRARARGLSRSEALQAHLEAIDTLQGASAPFLRVIEGGLK